MLEGKGQSATLFVRTIPAEKPLYQEMGRRKRKSKRVYKEKKAGRMETISEMQSWVNI